MKVIKDLVSFNVKRSIGSCLMIAGSCIGIGMLAMPVSTSFAGFIPSLCAFIICWLFMQSTALYLIEITSHYPRGSNFISLATSILGKKGKYATWGAFLFLFYCLLVAYIAKGGDLIQIFLTTGLSLNCAPYTGSLVLAVISGLLVFWGTLFVDRFNFLCMIGLVLAYFYLIIAGRSEFAVVRLSQQNWEYFLFILPFIIPAFGFHNLLPTLKNYLDDNKLLKRVVWIGGLLPLLIYIFWVMSMQGILPRELLHQSFSRGEIATETFATHKGNSFLSLVGSYLAFFAIITSLITQALSILDFLIDGFKVKPTKKSRSIVVGLIFLPAFLFSQLSPNIFFLCLEWAGGIATMILFGLLPAFMIWKTRTQSNCHSAIGKVHLTLIIGFSTLLMSYEVFKVLSYFL